MYKFLEFFAGGGMVRAALEDWQCVFANDFDIKKCQIYAENWGGGQCPELHCGDIRAIKPQDVPSAHLAWASFPCQDLSLAGGGAGLKGERSGTFYRFWGIMEQMASEGRAPDIIALENVTGTLTSHQGKDFETICQSFAELGYNYGALVIDASYFVPQSRKRLFVIGVRGDLQIPNYLTTQPNESNVHTKALLKAFESLDAKTQKHWVWWNVEMPLSRRDDLKDILEGDADVDWFSTEKTQRLLSLMNESNLNKIEKAKAKGLYGTVYKRTRKENNKKVQRAEVRFDSVAGCLRTPAGGSSKQIIISVTQESVKARLMTPRETARLMALPDSYILPNSDNDAYHITGDGVVVSVVQHLKSTLFESILDSNSQTNLLTHLAV